MTSSTSCTSRSRSRSRAASTTSAPAAARTFLDLARATFAALGAPEHIDFIDMPDALRERYQYFTEARMDRLRAAGYRTPFTTLEDGVRQYVTRLKSNP